MGVLERGRVDVSEVLEIDPGDFERVDHLGPPEPVDGKVAYCGALLPPPDSEPHYVRQEWLTPKYCVVCVEMAKADPNCRWV